MRYAIMFVLVACACGPAPVPDGGVDAGPSFSDGGAIDAVGGCYWRANGQKFILSFEAPSGLCTNVSFRRRDAGSFAERFAAQVRGPDSAYGVDDARVGLCSWPEELPDGSLNPQASPIDDFRADLQWFVQGGHPLTWAGSGTISYFGNRYWFRTPDGNVGMMNPCLGP